MDFGHSRSPSHVTSTSRDSFQNDDEQALKWAALERLPTYDRARKGLLHGVAGDFKEIDLQKLRIQERKELLDRLIGNADKNEEFLKKLRKRIDRVTLDLPTIERFTLNLQLLFEYDRGYSTLPSYSSKSKKEFSVLSDVSGIIKPGRLTLLLGPPGSGKSTLLKALSGKLDSELKFSGKVTYNGHEMHEFVPQRTSAYISQYDVHLPLLTVRETLTFSAKCQGVGTGYEMLTELLRREKELNIQPDPYIDALMKASVLKGHKEHIVTDYVLKLLGLDVCADTIVGNNMIRGISGGQKKRVTTGEMLVGPVNALFMDNISNGLDSSTTFQIINSIRQSTHIMNKSALISLLQPPPETYELFDDIILLSEGQIVYEGSREYVLEFFEFMGFRCPQRKAIADYLQEVISWKDQRQYWEEPSNESLAPHSIGPRVHPASLTRSKYGTNIKELMKACLSREVILMKRSAHFHILKTIQIEICAIIAATVFAQARKHHNSVEDGLVYLGALYFGLLTIMFSGFSELPSTIDKLPVFYKQRDLLFYPSWAFSLPVSILGIPISFIEVACWVATTYYVIGFDPSGMRLLRHFLLLTASAQMSYSLFRCMAALSRDHIVANTVGCLAFMGLLLFGGFIISRENAPNWLVWGFWLSPLTYAQTALSTNEFLGKAWKQVNNGSKEALGISVLKTRGVLTNPHWPWTGLFALIGFIFILNGISALALAYLNQYGKSQVIFLSKDTPEKATNRISETEGEETLENGTSSGKTSTNKASKEVTAVGRPKKKGMHLPFMPLSLTFENIRYSVDMPKAIKDQGVLENRLELLKGVNGAFRPGVLTALMGVSGAGKTTLLDVLAGRKNCGYLEGNVTVSGYPKRQETFARVSGYCEQNDIHSPLVTVYESLIYSAWLRLPTEVDAKTKEAFVEEVMELIELTSLREALVGFPNVNGLSTEQRKRLTIAVELVANPSIIFMDEPTTGLDARAAAIVMRTVRSTVDTGRTVVCTIHQPSIDIFESFDELVLLTCGGEEIYVGPLGPQSRHLINYFEEIYGVGKIKNGHNPATWALEVTTKAQEEALGIKFADVYKQTDLFRRNKALLRELTCLWKQHKSYWRNTPYNAVRLVFSTSMAIIFGVIFRGLGSRRRTKQEIFNGLGAMYSALMFLGPQSAGTVQPVLAAERAVFYRERAAGMYSTLPFAIAQATIEIPYVLVQVLIYGIIVYSMIDYEWTATKYFQNMFFMFITILYHIYYGMMVMGVSPNKQVSSIVSGIFYSTWNLFTGFVIPRTRIAVWWRWYAWVSPVSWSFYGLATSQYGDIKTKLETGETVAEFIRDYFGFRYDFLWVVSLALIGFCVFFVSVFAVSLKALNFQKR
ncbi:hypothetical protein SLA2020_448900 [Shorea laevis]